MKPLLLALLTAYATPALAEYGPPAPISFVDAEGPVTQPETPAQRISKDDRSLIETIGRNRFVAHSVAAALDAGTTYRCSHRRTCEEGNPALRKLFGKRLSLTDAVGAFLVMEGVYVGGSVLIGETAGYDSTARDIFQLSMIGTHGIAAGLNLRF